MKKLILILTALFLMPCTPLLASTNGMAFVPGGSFDMGDYYKGGDADEWDLSGDPTHSVNISSFYIDTNEVTKALWDEVKAWGATNGYTDLPSGSAFTNVHPVANLSWLDCLKWCNARSEKESLPPVYYTSALKSQIYRTGNPVGNPTDSYAAWDTDGYRLPTEAEWEKACRGGMTNHHFSWDSSGGTWQDHTNAIKANYLESKDVFETGTTPIGSYETNRYGLHDMAGNISEWCWDKYDVVWYRNLLADDDNTHGPIAPIIYRVLRGGSYTDPVEDLRCANRDSHHYSNAGSTNIGFRCVINGKHLVLDPDTPTGSSNGYVNDPLAFNTGGSACSRTHNVEYRFDWGDNSTSSWSTATGATNTWNTTNTYSIKAQARCETVTSITSQWSSTFQVSISNHVVSIPDTPAGPSSGLIGDNLEFYTGSTTCSLSHAVQYMFNWDGSSSSWLTAGDTNEVKNWSTPGIYNIRARARCNIDNSVTSDWSSTWSVNISNHYVSTPITPVGSDFAWPDLTLDYYSGGSTCSFGHAVEYRFNWNDGTYSAWSGSTNGSHSWSANGTYYLKAETHCVINTNINNQSATKTLLLRHDVSQPAQPAGITGGYIDQGLKFTTGSSTCEHGHNVEYHFWWGPGEGLSPWTTNTIPVTNSWSTTNTYEVRAKVRCTSNTAFEVDSSSIFVTIKDLAIDEIILIDTNKVELHWQSFAGQLYTIYSSTNLPTDGLSELQSSITGTPPENIYTNTFTGPQHREYRLKATAP